MTENAVALAAIALTGTVVAGFFKLINDQNKVHAKIAHGLDKVAESNKDIAKETKGVKQEAEKGNLESAERNGHLGELIIQQGKQTEKIANKAVSAIIEGTQNVTEQKVEHQTVKAKD